MKTAMNAIACSGLAAAGGVAVSWYVWDRTVISMSWYVAALIVLGLLAVVAAVNWLRKRGTA